MHLKTFCFSEEQSVCNYSEPTVVKNYTLRQLYLMWGTQKGHRGDAACWGYLEGFATRFKDGLGQRRQNWGSA